MNPRPAAPAAGAHPSADRLVAAAPAGVLHCLGQEADAMTRRVFELLLGAGTAVHLHLPGMAGRLGADTREVGRALFALVRESCITVGEQAAKMPAHGAWAEAAGLDDDLAVLAAPGQKLVLATGDGLCVARCGWSVYEADVVAARRPQDGAGGEGSETWPLRVGAQRLRLCATTPVNQAHPALLQLAGRLFGLFGPDGAARDQEAPCRSC